jgi:hypothetical protein
VRDRTDGVRQSGHAGKMDIAKIVGILLIVAGGLGLITGGFSYTSETHSAKLGPMVLQVQEKETIHIPMLLSGAAIAVGLFLLFGLKRK